MISRIQIRAKARSAHEVEDELRAISARLSDAFSVEFKTSGVVIEGTPGESFEGRASLTVVAPRPTGPLTITETVYGLPGSRGRSTTVTEAVDEEFPSEVQS